MIKKFFKDITGITAKEAAEKEQALIQQKTAQRKIELAEKRRIAKEYKKEKEAELKLTPKEFATKKKEPWVDVIGFNINKDNIRNGFYELDWNEYFIAELQEYKRLHDNNNSYIHVYENISMLSSCIYDLLQHVYTFYDNN